MYDLFDQVELLALPTLPVFPPEGYEDILKAFPVPLIATAILLTSSLTMQWGTSRIRKGDRTGLNRAVAVTLTAFFQVVKV